MINTPEISSLRLANWPKIRGDSTLSPTERTGAEKAGLFLDTCLRQMCLATTCPDELPGVRSADAIFLRGTDAYRFALEVATGLRSAIPGETNVCGQFRDAWQTYRQNRSPTQVARLAPIIHQLINDARSIRQQHLQGIGGASYGTLVRRLLSARRDDRILFIGAGDLARSMLPYFSNYTVGIWNYRPVADADLAVDRTFAPQQAVAAARWADHVVLTTPPDHDHDTAWQTRLTDTAIRSLVHLGHRRGELRQWPIGATCHDLDDVFALRRQQAGLRSVQLERASLACRKAARQLTDAQAKLPLAGLATA